MVLGLQDTSIGLLVLTIDEAVSLGDVRMLVVYYHEGGDHTEAAEVVPQICLRRVLRDASNKESGSARLTCTSNDI